MSPSDFIAQAHMRLEAGIPFVLYAEPGATEIKGIFSSGKPAINEFVFAPFDNGKMLKIPFDRDDVAHATLPSVPTGASAVANPSGRDEFIGKVERALIEIGQGRLQKVVLSRAEDIALAKDRIFEAFARMVNKYAPAFTYCWFHPDSGLWMGATPERLLRAVGSDFYTMALAGTMPADDSGHYAWGGKEKAEQRYVTDYIVEKLRPLAAEIGQHGPVTAQAGSIVHLKTEISGVLKPEFAADDLVRALHPTPAVCGIPPSQALAFILENEGYDREYYSGYLGICSPGKTDLYVNLRCMKWQNGTARLFMGCGINHGSDAGCEFEETVNKSITIKSIL